MELPENLIQNLKKIQRDELNEYFVYTALSKKVKDQKNSEILMRIAKEELAHANFWKKYTQTNPKVSKFKIVFYKIVGIIFGLTFSLKLMEKSEQKAQDVYKEIKNFIPEAENIIREEDAHENELINMVDEEKLEYAGAIVLGLNDALVELTGALAGLTFALQNTSIIAIVGFITGIAASFSMSASSYLSAKAEDDSKNHIKSAIYTGVAYISTVVLLVIPYLIFQSPYLALLFTVSIGILIIFIFNFYISVAKDYPFKKRFLEMVIINIVVTSITFLIGVGIRKIFNVEV